jgi:hypothetical protein
LAVHCEVGEVEAATAELRLPAARNGVAGLLGCGVERAQLALGDDRAGTELVLQGDRGDGRQAVVLVGAYVDPGRRESKVGRGESGACRPVRAGLVVKDAAVVE